MTDLLPFIVGGLVSGSLYGLAGVGLVLTFRASGVFNFAHGALAAGAAFLFNTLYVDHGWSWPLAALCVILSVGIIVGVVLERLTRRLPDVAEPIAVVLTVGLLLAIQGLIFMQYGAATTPAPAFLPTTGFVLSGVHISWAQVISVAVATTAACGLYLFLQHARLGIAMRAVVESQDLLALTGQRPTQVRTLAWVVGSAFAAATGILIAPTLNLDAVLLTLLVVQAFGACAIGRFSSLPLTYAGGLAIGVASAVSTKYLTDRPWSGLSSSVPFLVLIAVLLLVPAARLPRRTKSRFVQPPSPSFRLHRRGLVALGVGVAVFLLAVPDLVGTKLPLWTSGASYVVIFASLGLLVWTSGQISLCHMSFVAVGVTSMAHLTSHLPWGLALVGAGLCAVPVGALVAIPAIRLSGIYLGLATLGFAILMQNVVFGTFLMFGSGLTVNVARPDLAFIDTASDAGVYRVILVVAAASVGLIALAGSSRLGRLLNGLAESPTMLSAQGLNLNLTRLIVFCISAFFAGIGGALSVTQTNSAGGVGYGPMQSLVLVAVLAICGRRLLPSAILAALLFAIVPGYATTFDPEQQSLVFGTLAVAAAVIVASRSRWAPWFDRAAATSAYRIRSGPVSARIRRAVAPPAPGAPPDTGPLISERGL